jgi:hypothetical protein
MCGKASKRGCSMRLYHFTAPDHGLSSLANQRLKVALLHEMNDPFELMCVNARSKPTRQALRRLKDWAHDRFGALCFSPHWSNPMMWSHYGAKHRGVALEVEVNPFSVIEVRYRKTRVEWDAPRVLGNGGFTPAHAEQIFSTKSAHWQYEEERRVAIDLRQADRDGSLYFERLGPMLQIVGVVLGPLCTITDSQIRAVVPRGRTVVVRNSRLAFKSFDVVPDKARKPRPVVGVRQAIDG